MSRALLQVSLWFWKLSFSKHLLACLFNSKQIILIADPEVEGVYQVYVFFRTDLKKCQYNVEQ